MPKNNRIAAFVAATLAACIAGAASAANAAELSEPVNFDIQSQPLDTALLKFSQQAGIQVFLPSRSVEGKKTPGVQGEHVAEQALKTLLKDSGLVYKRINSHTVAVGPATDKRASLDLSSFRIAQAETTVTDQPPAADEPAADAEPAKAERKREKVTTGSQGVPEILVEGTKVLNMDVARSRDDPQPYVIFDRARLERSNPANLQDFLKERLPMNAVRQSNAQDWGGGNTSSINLRGLGTGNTLILVDGHRTANRSTGGDTRQFDLNNIPVEAIERIEVLPATASGIYGGSATGGVVNVILRRDYTATDVKLSYENSFEAESGIRRLDFTSGLAFEEGRTNLLVAASASKQHSLYERDRDFAAEGRELRTANNPASLERQGGPPLGATPNIRSVNGSNLVLKSGIALGSRFTSSPVGYAGIASDGGAALAANAGRYNLDLPDSAVSWDVRGGGAAIINAPETRSVDVTLRRQFTPHVQAFIELNTSSNEGTFPLSFVTPMFTLPATSPSNPFTQDIQVTIPGAGNDQKYTTKSADSRGVAGVIAQLGAGWQAETDFTWDRTAARIRYPTRLSPDAATAIIAGQYDILSDQPLDLSPYQTEVEYDITPNVAILRDAVVRASGPVVKLPGGSATVSAVLEHRSESLSETQEFESDQGIRTYPGRAQTVQSAYLELRVPVVSAANALPGVRELELQLAGRLDKYGTDSVSGFEVEGSEPSFTTRRHFSSTNPTLALRYQPLQSLTLRGSWGTGFLAPTVGQFSRDSFVGTYSFYTDPLRGNEAAGPFDYYFGGSPDLMPEKSKSWSAGLIWSPTQVPGLRASADWTHITKTNNIVVVPADFVLMESLGLLKRAPVAPGDPYGVGKITELHFNYINLARAKAEALDTQVDYHWETPSTGSFDFFLVGTWQPHYITQNRTTDPSTELAGTYTGPLKKKANAGITWQRNEWTVGWLARFFDSYYINTNHAFDINQGSATIGNQTYHDVFAAYRFASVGSGFAGDLLSGSEITLGVKNVFNKRPPLDLSSASENQYSYYGDPRLAVYYMTIRKSFGR